MNRETLTRWPTSDHQIFQGLLILLIHEKNTSIPFQGYIVSQLLKIIITTKDLMPTFEFHAYIRIIQKYLGKSSVYCQHECGELGHPMIAMAMACGVVSVLTRRLHGHKPFPSSVGMIFPVAANDSRSYLKLWLLQQRGEYNFSDNAMKTLLGSDIN